MKTNHAVLVTLPLLLSGCVYFHNDAKQKLAEEARAQFATAVSQSTAVTAGVDLKGRHQLLQSLSAEFQRTDENIALGTLLDKTWGQLASECSASLQASQAGLQSGLASQGQFEAGLKEQITKLPGVQTNISDLVEALNEAAKSAARYASTQDLLKESLLTLVDDTLTNGWSNLTNLLGEQRTFVQYTRGADGSLKEQQKTNTLSQLLEIDPMILGVKLPENPKELESLKSVFEKLPGNLAGGITFKHPGISATLIGLAYDLAQAEEKRIREEIAYAKSCINVQKEAIGAYKNFTSALNLELRSKTNGGDGIVVMGSDFATSPDETVRTTLDGIVLKYQRAVAASMRATDNADADKHRQEAQNQREYLALAYRALARTFSLRTKEHQIASLENQLEMLNSEHALRVAAINIEEREAVIRRGLEGLVAFHNGGLNQEDLARIIGLAQTAGIFWIGAK